MARPKSAHKRTTRITTPASEMEASEWEEACRLAEVEPSDTLRKLIRAFCVCVKEHGRVVFPLRLASPDKSPPTSGTGDGL
jgi:hypothetical protein